MQIKQTLKRLGRSDNDQMVGGVCAGIAESTDTPVWMWRGRCSWYSTMCRCRSADIRCSVVTDAAPLAGRITSRCCGRTRVAAVVSRSRTIRAASRCPPQIVIRYAAATRLRIAQASSTGNQLALRYCRVCSDALFFGRCLLRVRRLVAAGLEHDGRCGNRDVASVSYLSSVIFQHRRSGRCITSRCSGPARVARYL